MWEGDFVSSEGTARGVNYVNLNGSLIAKLVADWELPAQRTSDGRTPKLSDVFRNVFADAGATAIVAPADGSTAQRLADVPVTYYLRYVHTDALGSPVLETNADGQEIDGTRTQYEPYGAPLPTPHDGSPSYTGHQYDTGTGLIYAQQRYYDPQLGVFYSPDPMAVDTTSAFNFNRYAYANNSPYKFTDPDGRFAQFIWGAVVGVGVEIFVQTAIQGKSFSDIDYSDVAVAAGSGALTGGIASGAALAAAKGSISVGAAVAQTAAGSGAVAVTASLAGDIANGETPDAKGALTDGAAAALTAGAGQRLSLGRLAGVEGMAKRGGLSATVAETTRLANEVGNDSAKLAAATSAAGSNAAEYGGLAADAIKAKVEEELK